MAVNAAPPVRNSTLVSTPSNPYRAPVPDAEPAGWWQRLQNWLVPPAVSTIRRIEWPSPEAFAAGRPLMFLGILLRKSDVDQPQVTASLGVGNADQNRLQRNMETYAEEVFRVLGQLADEYPDHARSIDDHEVVLRLIAFYHEPDRELVRPRVIGQFSVSQA